MKNVRIVLALALVLAFAAVGARAWFVSPMMTSGQAGSGGGAATASLSASPSSIVSGTSSTLTWGSTGAPSCISPGSLGNTAIPGFTGGVTGSASVSPTANTTYSIQCGSATAFAAVAVTGGGGTVACDYGPNTTLPTGIIGTDLATAGFTHCILNADFTDSSGTTLSHGWIMNNPATYINECAAPVTRTNGQFWFMWVAGAGSVGQQGGDAPCRPVIANDGTGTNVLTYSFAPSDIVAGSSQATTHVGLGLWWPICGDGGTCGSMSGLPVPHYAGITYRLSAGNSQSRNLILDAAEELSFIMNGAAGFLDESILEAEANNDNNSHTSLDNYLNSCPSGGKCNSNFAWEPGLQNYHTDSYMFTSNGTDGSSNATLCRYNNNAAITKIANSGFDGTYCGHYPGFLASELVHDHSFWHFIGDFTNWNPPPHTSDLSNTITIQIKAIQIFGCAPYTNASLCTGTVVFH